MKNLCTRNLEKLVSKTILIRMRLICHSKKIILLDNFELSKKRLWNLFENLKDNSEHSHKKRKDSLETRAKPAVLCVYVENQAIIEPILLYRVSKCKQTKEQGCEDCLWTHIFTFFRDYCTLFFPAKMEI